MAPINTFNQDEEDQESTSLGSLGSLGSIFGSTSEEVLKPRGSATLGDYFTDIVFQAPAKGLGTAVKGLLQIPAFAIDFAFDTDMFQELIDRGFKIPIHETNGGWLEIHNRKDLDFVKDILKIK